MEIQKLGNNLPAQTTKESWQNGYDSLPVRANMEAIQVVSMRTPALSTVNAGTGSRENGIVLMEVIIYGIWKYLDGDWSAAQARECAEMMFAEYHWMSASELKHLSLKAKQGAFKCLQNYAKFSPKMMAMCFAEYEAEILPLRASQQHLKQPEPDMKQIEAPVFDTSQYVKAITDILTGVSDLSEQQKKHDNILPEEYARQMGIDIDQLKKPTENEGNTDTV